MKAESLSFMAMLQETIASPAHDEPPLSAVVLYREFTADAAAAFRRHAGATLVLEGRRGTLIETSSGGAAIHIADGFTDRALVLRFADLRQVQGIAQGEKFRFRCRVRHFDNQHVYMDNCAIV